LNTICTRTTLFDGGREVEMAIPFKSLRYAWRTDLGHNAWRTVWEERGPY
jgi:hypothetical protein